jgi:hypothetical protein
VEFATPVAILVAVTLTPGINALEESSTVPVNTPFPPCANKEKLTMAIRHKAATA